MAEKNIERLRKLHIIFVDFKMAYGTVPVNKLWEAMKDKGMPIHSAHAVKQFYSIKKSD